MGSVQFQIVRCSSLYFFSRSIGSFQCLVNVNYRVLICCTRHFQSILSLFILASSVCKSLWCLISTLTQWGEGGHLLGSRVQLCCGERETLQTNITGMCGGVLIVYGPHWIFPCSQQRVLSGSTLLRLQVALQEYCPKQTLCFMHFPGLSFSGSGFQVLLKGTDLIGRVFCMLPKSEQLRQPSHWRAHCPMWTMCLNHFLILAAWFPGFAARALSQVCCVSPLGS